MRQLVIAGLIALTASTAMASVPQTHKIGKRSCTNMWFGMITTGATVIGIPVAFGLLTPYVLGCRHHKEYKAGGKW